MHSEEQGQERWLWPSKSKQIQSRNEEFNRIGLNWRILHVAEWLWPFLHAYESENQIWIDTWPKVRPKLLTETTSDYFAFLVDLQIVANGLRPFRFFSSWLRTEDFNKIFSDVWAVPQKEFPLHKLFLKMKFVKESTKAWTVINENPRLRSRIIAEKLHKAVENWEKNRGDKYLQEEGTNLKRKLA